MHAGHVYFYHICYSFTLCPKNFFIKCVLVLDDLTLTNVSDIPEDGLEAETYYSQFENEFEDEGGLVDQNNSNDSEYSDDDGEVDELVYQMQAALELGTQETLVEDESVSEIFSQSMRQQRIKGLRQYPLLQNYNLAMHILIIKYACQAIL